MSRNLLDHARENRDMLNLKQAFKSIGCDCDFDDINGAAEAIRKLSTVPTVVNATLMPGPGIKITPIERKGYKISATDEARLTVDINEKYCRGTSVHNVLNGIVRHDIPKAIRMAIRAPRVADIEVFKVYDDGIDYYNNPYFGPKGQGRKTGLQPCAWYIKIYTTSQVEPLYVCLSPMVEDLRRSILIETRREADKAIAAAIEALKNGEEWPGCTCGDHHHHHHHHHRPCCPCEPVDPPVDPEEPVDPPVDPEEPVDPPVDPDDPNEKGPIIYEQPIDPSTPPIEEGHEPTGCPICDRDKNFGGYDDDPGFSVDSDIEGEDFDDFLNSLDKEDE